jgi:uncharacterized protein
VTRDEALTLLKTHMKTKNLIFHMLATEAVMKAVARKLSEDEELFGLAGLLHDVDLDIVGKDMSRHGKVGSEILEKAGVAREVVHAVLAHPGHVACETKLDRALYAVDQVTGLIVACALIHPSKSLAGISSDFVLNRFKEKRFAAGANREQMKTCSDIGFSLEDFIVLSYGAMLEIAAEIGLAPGEAKTV